jgi:hypothetical protein
VFFTTENIRAAADFAVKNRASAPLSRAAVTRSVDNPRMGFAAYATNPGPNQ